MTMAELAAMRVDKWLWAARFYKTRRLAAEAVQGGKVHVNGQRCKPSREIKVGSQISLHKDSLHWQLTVTLLQAQRRPAKEAALLYQESAESQAQRQRQLAAQREIKAFLPFQPPARKPNKKDRRLIHRFKQA